MVVTVFQPNRAPIADAGPDQEVEVGALVQLDGSDSSDPDGDELTYRWIAPPKITLSSTTDMQPEFTALAVGTYRITLVVSDGQVESEADEVVVTVFQPNRAPVADAGPDQEVEVGAVVQLDGSDSSDPDGDNLKYTWTQAGGGSLTLSNSDTATPIFTPVESGNYIFSLVVNDGQVDSEPDEVVITVIQLEETTGDAEIIGEIEEDTGDAEIIGEVTGDTGEATIIGSVEN